MENPALGLETVQKLTKANHPITLKQWLSLNRLAGS